MAGTPDNATAQHPAVELRGVSTRFGDTVVHRAIDLDVEAGQILGLVGGSGSGKGLSSILTKQPDDGSSQCPKV